MILIKNNGNYKRTQVKADADKAIYVFTDNGDRTSGSHKIPDDSGYSTRFGKTGLCYPTTTSALIRGIDNEFPITTQKRYVKGSGFHERDWTDDGFDAFKKVIDDDFEHIQKACVQRKIDTVVFPEKGILNSSIARITLTRTPKLFGYIVDKEIELKRFNIDKLTKKEIEYYESN
jgi:hypothetical protein